MTCLHRFWYISVWFLTVFLLICHGGHKLGILWDSCEHGKLREFCATSGKNCNKQSIFSLSFRYLVRVWWWPVVLLELMWNDRWWRSLLHLLFVAITYGKVSLQLWKSLENSGNFFLLLCGYRVNVRKLESDLQMMIAVLTDWWNCHSICRTLHCSTH